MLAFWIGCYLISEVLNIIIRPYLGFDGSDYLSYVSTKSLITLPSLYYLHKKKVFSGLVLLVLTIPVLITYSTRMIIVTYVLAVILLFIVRIIRDIKISVLLVSFFTIAIYLFSFFDFQPEGFKATSIFLQFFSEGSLSESIRIIDPVRYGETVLFFKRGIFSILSGEGLGSGLHDIHGELYFIKVSDTAFSEKELNNNVFYNLHDTWIDIGLRFGLLFIIYLYYYILKLVLIQKKDILPLVGLLLIILFSCATYSTQGLILIAFFFFYAKSIKVSKELIK
ncbi:MAG: hypothetical protein K2P31_01845 [Rickettsiaceae bacterium]|nr:hypothetical protein [Rickettsiaceae bacterium]